jgi:hypothetical protein
MWHVVGNAMGKSRNGPWPWVCACPTARSRAFPCAPSRNVHPVLEGDPEQPPGLVAPPQREQAGAIEAELGREARGGLQCEIVQRVLEEAGEVFGV